MKILRLLLLLTLFVVVAVGVAVFVIFDDTTRGPLPVTSGEITLAPQTVTAAGQTITISGLNAPVEILRDAWGVPHIYASNTHDLFMAQGYTHAQDRWWQMEFSRATGDGRLQELTGANESLMSSDVFIRTIGWRRSAERDVAETYDEETLALMQAFADGVNAYILNRSPDDLALEYRLLGVTGVDIQIHPWTVADTIVWNNVMSWDLSGGMRDRRRAELLDLLGADLVDAYLPAWPFGEKPTILYAEDLPLTEDTLTTQAAQAITFIPQSAQGKLAGNVPPDIAFAFGSGEGIGSNNWVVSGERTTTGMPLLSNDPHLGIRNPSIWYEVGLHCQPVSDECPYDVRGFALTPFPGIVIGYNAQIAWGFTNVAPDVMDLYTITVNPENPLQYQWDGEWRDMTVVEETIRFGDGGDPVTIQVRETHLGPIINDNQISEDGEILGFNNENPLAMHWTGIMPSQTLRAIFAINRARNWEEFRAGAADFAVPSQNLVYADIEGNIGYQMPGLVPIRPASNSGIVPVDGSTSANEWLGYIPFDELPRVLNPARGYIATANQAVVPLEFYDQLAERLGDEFGADANYVINTNWDHGYRGQRITEMLLATDQHDIASFSAILGDNKIISAEEIMPSLMSLSLDDGELAQAREWLADWDYQLHMDSPQAAFYMQFWMKLMDNLFDDQLGDYAEAYGGSGEMRAVYLLLEQPEHAWWDDISTTDVRETRDDILLRSLQEGYDATVAALGSDRATWRWGTLHTATFISDPLGQSGIGILEDMVNRGPVPASGGASIVNATSWGSQDDFTVRAVPSMRMIIDLGNLDNSVNIHTTGQSGHPFSPHFADMIDPWRMIAFKPMPLSRAAVEAGSETRLTLQPGE